METFVLFLIGWKNQLRIYFLHVVELILCGGMFCVGWEVMDDIIVVDGATIPDLMVQFLVQLKERLCCFIKSSFFVCFLFDVRLLVCAIE